MTTGEELQGGPEAEFLLGGPLNDTIRGGAGDDTIAGDTGDDLLKGEDGDDFVKGEDGHDTLYGGGDNDTLKSGDGNDLNYGNTGNDFVQSGAGDDTSCGGEGADTLVGDTGDDLLKGEDGNDLVYGGPGNDTIYGGAGEDILKGNEGDDEIHGNTGNDEIFGGGLDEDEPGSGNDTLFGGAGDDTIRGGDGEDVIDGGEGDDIAYGGAGDDTITGGPGNNILFGGDGQDSFNPTAGDTVFGGSGGIDYDTLDLRGLGPLRIVDRVTDSDGNGFDGRVELLDGDGNVTGEIVFENIENIIPCFTPGTLIATPKGERPVEELKAGDKIITRDNGIQEIRWIGARSLTWQELAASPHLQPVLIRRGSLGNGLPEQDMLVSPNHRMLVANSRTALYFDEHEVLVAAKHLVDHQGVRRIDSMGTTYIHFMFDRHEVVLANGAWTESFQPGDQTLKGMGNAQRNEIFELFPELKSSAGVQSYLAARKTLKAHEARLLF
jgi:Ca2+-binding RTX toxin-like protein